jgi:hypothetical protein
LAAKDKIAAATSDADDEATKRSLIRHPLDTLAGLIAEATRVYRAARNKKLDHSEARSLVWMLAQMRGMVETQALERLEQRLEEIAPSIDGGNLGYKSPNRPPRAPH